MREARIIIPVEGSLVPVSDAMQAILQAFNGVTEYTGIGKWLHPNGQFLQENIRIFDIAYLPSRLNDAKLYDIAWQYRHDAHQVEVYLRYGNGHVQMVRERGCMDNGEKEGFDWDQLKQELHRPNDDLSDVIEHADHVDINAVNV